jgi:hypothetical protein
MISRIACTVALALAATTASAQTAKAPATTKKPATATPAASAGSAAPRQNSDSAYVPAVMHEKMVTVSGCLKNTPSWELTDATVADQKDKATYRLEGISAARLSLFIGKRVQATGALQNQGTSANGKTPPRFEATAVQEVTGAAAASCS